MNDFNVKSVADASDVRTVGESNIHDNEVDGLLYEDTLQSSQLEDIISSLKKMDDDFDAQSKREQRHFVITLLVSLIAAAAAVVSVILSII